MKKTILAVLIAFCLLHVITIESSIAYKDTFQFRGAVSIITVDDEGDGNYTSIKDALMHAVDGDIIEVYSGTYQEHNIIINTSNLTLKGLPYELGVGDDAGKPFIDGQGIRDVIDILSLSVTITGFHIENRGENTAQHIIGIDWDAHNCIISENELHYTIGACITSGSNNNLFLNNNISHSSISVGIGIAGDNNKIMGNSIANTPSNGGVSLHGVNNTLIMNNEIGSCFSAIEGGGINNTIKLNTFRDSLTGITFVGWNSSVVENNFINNDRHAIFTEGSGPANNVWDGNYWGRPRILPKLIFGGKYPKGHVGIPWVKIDWHPALRPYVI